MKQLFLSALTLGAVIGVFFSPLMAEEVLEESGDAFLRQCSVVEKDHDLTSADKAGLDNACRYYPAALTSFNAAMRDS